MTDKWIEDKYWSDKIADLKEWIAENENDEELEDTIDVLNLNIKRGTKKPESREKCWNGILLEMRGIEGSPVGGKGAASKLPKEVQDLLKEVQTELEAAYGLSYTGVVKLVDFRRMKDDNENTIRYQHENNLAFGKAKASGKISMLKSCFNAEPQEWDGTREGLEALTTEIDVIEEASEEVATDDS